MCVCARPLRTSAFREGHFRRAAPARSSVGPFIRPSVRTIRLRRTAGAFGEPLGLLEGETRIYGLRTIFELRIGYSRLKAQLGNVIRGRTGVLAGERNHDHTFTLAAALLK